mmetsp:Transcript_63484/g.160113  ORF Transcript_63484/g.160113 Transcript_63484/m.160113 type:complete len:227 (+) Transcript_63484:230-910(+)
MLEANTSTVGGGGLAHHQRLSYLIIRSISDPCARCIHTPTSGSSATGAHSMPSQQSLKVVLHKLPTGLHTTSRSCSMAAQKPVSGPGDPGDISTQVRPSQQLFALTVQLLSAILHTSMQSPSFGSVADGAQARPEQQPFAVGSHWLKAGAHVSVASTHKPSFGSAAEGLQLKPEQHWFKLGLQWLETAMHDSTDGGGMHKLLFGSRFECSQVKPEQQVFALTLHWL